MIEQIFQQSLDAVAALQDVAVRTPLLESELLNERIGRRVLFKAECLQRTGSFKFRGAYFKLSRLTQAEKNRGVIAYSSGNHAQGVACAARLHNTQATIIVPEDAPTIKIARTKAYGGKVVLYDRYNEEREALAIPYLEQGLVLVPPYDDWTIIAGQATIGQEICADLQAKGLSLDELWCPVGGGGLMAGVSSVIKTVFPKCWVSGVEPSGYDDTARSLALGERVKNSSYPTTICDAIVTPMPGEKTFTINQRTVDACVNVDDKAVWDAIQLIREELKLVVEPTGAAALAAMLQSIATKDNKTAVVILSGGNTDSALKL